MIPIKMPDGIYSLSNPLPTKVLDRCFQSHRVFINIQDFKIKNHYPVRLFANIFVFAVLRRQYKVFKLA